MGTDTIKRTATIADLEQVEGRSELVDGEIIEMSPGSYEHGRVASRIDRILGAWCDRTKLGETVTCDTGFVLDERNVRAPDVAYIDAERAKQAQPQGFARFVPRLAVEVVSPNDAWQDVKAKARQWLAHGVDMVWIVDPRARTVEVHAAGRAAVEFEAGDTIDGGSTMPGFACRVGEFFG